MSWLIYVSGKIILNSRRLNIIILSRVVITLNLKNVADVS